MDEDYNEGHFLDGASEAPTEPGERYIEQAGVICLKECESGPKVLLIQGRRNGKWGIPKGSIETGETSRQAATREAFEEAGIFGQCEDKPLASFRYRKPGKLSICRVTVHLMHIESMTKKFPESQSRTPRWIDCQTAANIVADDGLAEILLALAGRSLG